MKRIMLTVAYDGSNYHGWQVQPNAITVEEVINKTLTDLLKESITVIGASRTDSGVHALGNVAVFDTNTKIPGDKISYSLNQRLPSDIVIRGSREVPPTFHPRYCNSIKTYQYKIFNSKFPLPTERLYSHFIYYPLDVEAMVRGAEYLIGEHDFKSFCSTKTQVVDTIRKIYHLDVSKNEDMITISISGNGFLYNMIRIISGTLIKVGCGVYPPTRVAEILEKRDRSAAGATAPAVGLTLKKIEYPDLI